MAAARFGRSAGEVRAVAPLAGTAYRSTSLLSPAAAVTSSIKMQCGWAASGVFLMTCLDRRGLEARTCECYTSSRHSRTFSRVGSPEIH